MITAAPHSDGGVTPALSRNFMLESGARLIENGYPVIPIIPGAKSPGQWSESRGWRGYKDWTRHRLRATSKFELGIWSGWPGCGVGIPCGTLHGVDIDLLDEPAALRIQALALDMLGDTPCLRIGRAPKRLLVYRSVIPFASIKRHPIEVLGEGAQFVAYGIHQDTQSPYFWPFEGLDECDLSRLPEISEAKALAFADAAWERVPLELRQRRLGPDRSDDYYYSGGDLRGTPEAIQAALEHIPNDDLDYDSWMKIGLALKGALGPAGESLFASWSNRSQKNKPRTTVKLFRGVNPERIGAGTIYYYAQENGWVPEHHLILSAAVAEALAAGAGFVGIASASESIIAIEPSSTGAPELGKGDTRAPGEPAPNGDARVTATTKPEASEEYDVVGEAGGLLGDLVSWMTSTARYPQPLLSLGASITLCGALMGHRYRLLDGPDTRTNTMVLGLAGSGSGKDHPRTCVTRVLRAAGLEKFYLGRGIASAPGIIGALASFHSGVMLLDEAGLFFAAVMDPRAPPYLRAVASLLMELSTSASTVFVDAARAGDREPNSIRFDIPDPCLNVFATTVPEPFWNALNSGAADSGFLARFLMLQTPVNYPDPQFGCPPIEEGITPLIGRLRQLVAGPGVQVTDLSIASSLNALQPRWEGEGGARKRHINTPEPIAVPMTPEAQAEDKRIAGLEAELKREHEGKTHATAILARTTEHTRRLALERAASRSPFLPEVDYSDIRWGFELAVMSQHLMLPAVEHYVADSPHEATLKRLLSIVRRHGDWIDLSTLSDRCYFLKTRDRRDAIAQLIEGGRLEHRQEPTKTKPRQFVRVRNGG